MKGPDCEVKIGCLTFYSGSVELRATLITVCIRSFHLLYSLIT